MHIYWLIILDNLYNLLTFTSLNFLNCKKQICMGGFLWGLQIVHELLPCPDSANNCQYHISLITQIIIAQIITTETLPTKVHIVKALVFPVVMYGCESWTIKKAEHWRIDAFELCCWITFVVEDKHDFWNLRHLLFCDQLMRWKDELWN